MPVPQVPVFVPGAPVGSLPARFNAWIRDPLTALLSPPRFRARRTTGLTVTEAVNQAVAWNSSGVDEDSHGGWSSGQPTRYTVPAGWSGWWLVTGAVSISGGGAAGLVLIPSIAVNGASHTGAGLAGWEGPEPFVAFGGLKVCSATWRVYASAGDRIELILYYSDESTITAVDTTPGQECRIELVWDGV
ncbi:hypothetical protein [Actinomadura hibisca]|uniref:hypothetical protein n=1 Tax=Actinomadura hibisca TaxID=68565 RepID=UPI000831A681|nr:hypothetical protein [Actinomadura hibisca]